MIYAWENKKKKPRFMPPGTVICDEVNTHICTIKIKKLAAIKSPLYYVAHNTTFSINMICKDFMGLFHFKISWIYATGNTIPIPSYKVALGILDTVGIYEDNTKITIHEDCQYKPFLELKKD